MRVYYYQHYEICLEVCYANELKYEPERFLSGVILHRAKADKGLKGKAV